MVDYYSGFWELDLLHSILYSQVIRNMEIQFARYGIPDVWRHTMTHSLPQKKYSQAMEVWKVTSSFHYPTNNDKAEMLSNQGNVYWKGQQKIEQMHIWLCSLPLKALIQARLKVNESSNKDLALYYSHLATAQGSWKSTQKATIDEPRNVLVSV